MDKAHDQQFTPERADPQMDQCCMYPTVAMDINMATTVMNTLIKVKVDLTITNTLLTSITAQTHTINTYQVDQMTTTSYDRMSSITLDPKVVTVILVDPKVVTVSLVDLKVVTVSLDRMIYTMNIDAMNLIGTNQIQITTVSSVVTGSKCGAR